MRRGSAVLPIIGETNAVAGAGHFGEGSIGCALGSGATIQQATAGPPARRAKVLGTPEPPDSEAVGVTFGDVVGF